MKTTRRLYLLFSVFILLLFIHSVAAKTLVEVDYYYSGSCGSCEWYADNVITPIQTDANYSDKVIIYWKDVGSNATNRQEMIDRGLSYPSAVINNEIKIPKANLTYETFKTTLDTVIADLEVNQSFDIAIIDIPFIGRINTSALSLPVLTIVLGGLDSFNPCSFFILIFLLNLLIYVQSRRRMLLVGGIFIFFSGFFYFLFMFVLFSSLLLTQEYVNLISILAGTIALIIGLLSIKDFFFFKKGISLSIPEDKKPQIFKKMRNLIKTSYLPAIIGGTIFLAITVNFYELLCTLGFPLIFTNRLTQVTMPLFQYYTYIFFYNVVYVIPLITILLIFTYTLGRMKLSEWQGRKLKLVSGIMIFSFGLLFIIDYQLLENVLTPTLFLLGSIISTLIISYLWEHYTADTKQEKSKEGES